METFFFVILNVIISTLAITVNDRQIFKIIENTMRLMNSHDPKWSSSVHKRILSSVRVT